MARLRTIALAIKSRLEEIAELTGKVVVYRRADIESQFEMRMGKTRGRCVIIRLVGGRNTSRQKIKPRLSGNYTISLFTTPLLTQKDAKDADDLMQEIVDKIHGWWPPGVEPVNNAAIYCDADSISFPDDSLYDVAVLSVDAPRTT